MKKIILSILIILTALGFLLCVWSCVWLFPQNGKGTLKVIAQYEPGEAGIVNSYSYILTGPQGQDITRSQGEREETFNDLHNGMWKIEICALDADDYILAEGFDDIEVIPDTTDKITIPLEELTPTPAPTIITVINHITGCNEYGCPEIYPITGPEGGQYPITTLAEYSPDCPAICPYQVFSHWSCTGGISINDPEAVDTYFTIDSTEENATITAHYNDRIIQVTITYKSTINCSGYYLCTKTNTVTGTDGDEFSITTLHEYVEPCPGNCGTATFDCWSFDEGVSIDNPNYHNTSFTISSTESDATIEAKYR